LTKVAKVFSCQQLLRRYTYSADLVTKVVFKQLQ